MTSSHFVPHLGQASIAVVDVQQGLLTRHTMTKYTFALFFALFSACAATNAPALDIDTDAGICADNDEECKARKPKLRTCQGYNGQFVECYFVERELEAGQCIASIGQRKVQQCCDAYPGNATLANMCAHVND